MTSVGLELNDLPKHPTALPLLLDGDRFFRELDGALRLRADLWLVMVEVEDLPKLEKSHGRLLKDRLFQAVLQSMGRGDVILARNNGNEFLALLINSSKHMVERYCWEVRREVREASLFNFLTREKIRVELNVGIAGTDSSGRSVLRLFADAKADLRNDRDWALGQQQAG
jgi:PleD family two-component response regulator